MHVVLVNPRAQKAHRRLPLSVLFLARALPPDVTWEIVDANAAEGRIEATATTFWYGFKDDVVVQVTPADGESRIDVRSVSRVGRSDVGTNAQRIRAYFRKLAT